MFSVTPSPDPRVISLDISDVLPVFPGFRVALLVASPLTIPASRSAAVDVYIARAAAEASAGLGEAALADLPELAAWRASYRAFGVKKTSYRSSVERLLKLLARGEGLPRVNPLVDLYNAVSARHRL